MNMMSLAGNEDWKQEDKANLALSISFKKIPVVNT